MAGDLVLIPENGRQLAGAFSDVLHWYSGFSGIMGCLVQALKRSQSRDRRLCIWLLLRKRCLEHSMPGGCFRHIPPPEIGVLPQSHNLRCEKLADHVGILLLYLLTA